MTDDAPQQEIKRPPAANDHLANERTFLAWMRTSIAMMGFGFVVVKFTISIKQLSLVLDGHLPPSKGYSAIIGILLVGLGAVMALLAYLRYRHIEKQLLSNRYFPSKTLSLLLTIAMILVSILLVLYLMPNL
jgi:putative membrane protein